ncbi:MAG: hypothetical protein EKK47_02485 [Burkholderiales bacterium]|nr:MAG: hypothetical protein EKK47_02485 [Burkholderiales bacterium]
MITSYVGIPTVVALAWAKQELRWIDENVSKELIDSARAFAGSEDRLHTMARDGLLQLTKLKPDQVERTIAAILLIARHESHAPT